jgi:serine/threonine protein kinase
VIRNPESDLPVRSPLGESHVLRPGASEGWVDTIVCPRCRRETPRRSDRCLACGYSIRETRAYESAGGLVPDTWIGRIINDKYRVVSVLGEGGFGVVYKVEFLLFDTCNTFALKLLHPSLSQDPKFRRRFLREAALAMQLVHEHTIQIREFGRAEDGSLFFTMDYCEGEPLHSVIAREQFLSVNRALGITLQILSVMSQAHSRGIIHRDLKPENVFLERVSARPGGRPPVLERCRDFVKVGDFGLAKSYRDSGGTTDITYGGILGTPRYMSPEQARGSDDLDHRSDIYSIGVMLWEMLYGEVPNDRPASDLDGDSILRTPSRPRQVVPAGVLEILRRTLTTRREDRFQSADEFASAIRSLPDYTPSYAEPDVAFAAGGIGNVAQRRAPLGLAALGAIALGAFVVGAALFAVFPEQRSAAARWVLERIATSTEDSTKASALEGAVAEVTPRAGASRSSDGSGSALSAPAERVSSFVALHPGAQFLYRVFEGDAAARPAAAPTSTSAATPLAPSATSTSLGSAAGVSAAAGVSGTGLSGTGLSGAGLSSTGLSGTMATELRFTAIEEPKPGVFEIRVDVSPAAEINSAGSGPRSSDRRTRWVVDDTENVFYEEFFLPNAETGDPAQLVRRERLRLPAVVSRVGDWFWANSKIHDRTYTVGLSASAGEYADCIVVETVEPTQRHIQYYKEGVGLVALEVYALPDDTIERLGKEFAARRGSSTKRSANGGGAASQRVGPDHPSGSAASAGSAATATAAAPAELEGGDPLYREFFLNDLPLPPSEKRVYARYLVRDPARGAALDAAATTARNGGANK